jgi:hypothetical protein
VQQPKYDYLSQQQYGGIVIRPKCIYNF